MHKSQGMSIDKAEIDLSRSFEKGMGYVALSRLRSLESLTLKGINHMAMMVNEEVLENDSNFRDESRKNTEMIRTISPDKLLDIQKQFLDRVSSNDKTRAKKPNTIEETRKLLIAGKTLKEIASARNLKVATIVDHLEKLKKSKLMTDFSSLAKEIPSNRLQEITTALSQQHNTENDTYHLAPARALLGDDYSYDEIRLARLLITE